VKWSSLNDAVHSQIAVERSCRNERLSSVGSILCFQQAMDENFNPNRAVQESGEVFGKPSGSNHNSETGAARADGNVTLFDLLGALEDGQVDVAGDIVAIRAGPETYHPVKALKGMASDTDVIILSCLIKAPAAGEATSAVRSALQSVIVRSPPAMIHGPGPGARATTAGGMDPNLRAISPSAHSAVVDSSLLRAFTPTRARTLPTVVAGVCGGPGGLCFLGQRATSEGFSAFSLLCEFGGRARASARALYDLLGTPLRPARYGVGLLEPRDEGPRVSAAPGVFLASSHRRRVSAGRAAGAGAVGGRPAGVAERVREHGRVRDKAEQRSGRGRQRRRRRQIRTGRGRRGHRGPAAQGRGWAGRGGDRLGPVRVDGEVQRRPRLLGEALGACRARRRRGGRSVGRGVGLQRRRGRTDIPGHQPRQQNRRRQPHPRRGFHGERGEAVPRRAFVELGVHKVTRDLLHWLEVHAGVLAADIDRVLPAAAGFRPTGASSDGDGTDPRLNRLRTLADTLDLVALSQAYGAPWRQLAHPVFWEVFLEPARGGGADGGLEACAAWETVSYTLAKAALFQLSGADEPPVLSRETARAAQAALHGCPAHVVPKVLSSVTGEESFVALKRRQLEHKAKGAGAGGDAAAVFVCEHRFTPW
ncbi:unnamed protein product, partial [Scytosiphon promiscuus]